MTPGCRVAKELAAAQEAQAAWSRPETPLLNIFSQVDITMRDIQGIQEKGSHPAMERLRGSRPPAKT